jgi:hypothetical protein
MKCMRIEARATLALLAAVFFGVGFTVHWLFVPRPDRRRVVPRLSVHWWLGGRSSGYWY